jgi:hypothetical protein
MLGKFPAVSRGDDNIACRSRPEQLGCDILIAYPDSNKQMPADQDRRPLAIISFIFSNPF